MTWNRHVVAVLGITTICSCLAAPPASAGQVNVDIGGFHLQVGEDSPPPSRMYVSSPDMEVLTYGPVHEAFAQPVTFGEDVAFTISERPPQPLEEIAPMQRPEGRHITWIPGYWSWDSERNGFIWVSGCWRAIPPNTSWLPGYWTRVSGGYRWTAGFWTSADTDEIEYLPEPPRALREAQPRLTNRDSIWIPGSWVRHDNRYVWRPGFWEQGRANWIWVPSQYVSTPRGWIYADGYWDYPLDRRGVAFLPVYYPENTYRQRDFQYTPLVVLDLNVLKLHLFSSPSRHHYYFGDYYGSKYVKDGYHPWHDSYNQSNWYDPIFFHEQWQHRDDSRWRDRQRKDFERRRNDASKRPPRNYDAMNRKVSGLSERQRNELEIGRPLEKVATTRSSAHTFGWINSTDQDAERQRINDMNEFRNRRALWERSSTVSKSAPDPRSGRPVASSNSRESMGSSSKDKPNSGAISVAPHEGRTPPQTTEEVLPPQRVRIPRSPITDRGAQERTADLLPPPRPSEPSPDPAADTRRMPNRMPGN